MLGTAAVAASLYAVAAADTAFALLLRGRAVALAIRLLRSAVPAGPEATLSASGNHSIQVPHPTP